VAIVITVGGTVGVITASAWAGAAAKENVDRNGIRKAAWW
jgi:hypothetical protein